MKIKATGDYAVGYGRPPRSSRFQKGKSGNPRGRRKNAKSIRTLLAAALEDKVTVNENGEKRKISKREAAVKQLANRIAMGDIQYIKLALALFADQEEGEEQASTAETTAAAVKRVTAKLDALAARFRTRYGLPPEGQT